MFQHLVKFLFCFTLLLSAEQLSYASAEKVENSLFDTEQVFDQQVGNNTAGFILIDLTEDDYNTGRPDFIKLKPCYKNSIANYQCTLTNRCDFNKSRCACGKFNIPHQNQDKEDPSSFQLS